MEYKLNKCLTLVGLMISMLWIFLIDKTMIYLRFVNSISRLLPLFMVLSWIFTISMNVKDIVREKEK